MFLIPVHPRGRGEHRPVRQNRRQKAGSSPRARGTHSAIDDIINPIRFIPAGAGNTVSSCVGTSAPPVHPRGRGEHDCTTHVAPFGGGSSPRARGTHQHAQHTPSRLRFIPAGAGNTPQPGRPEGRQAVHPRGRGEHTGFVSFFTFVSGSSPRARGTRHSSRRAPRRCRFIPAGAGNTSAQEVSV